MNYLVVDDQQARLIAEDADTLEIRDRAGNHLGYVAHGFSAEDVEIARQRAASGGPCLTTQQVLEHLQSLEGR